MSPGSPAGNEDDGTIGWIREIVLDSSDPQSLASFWASVLGGIGSDVGSATYAGGLARTLAA